MATMAAEGQIVFNFKNSVVAITLLLAGCATPYQESGLLGGVSATRVSEDTFQVVSKGNGFVDPATLQTYALRRAAETTVLYGYDVFEFASVQDSSQSWHSVGSAANVGYIKPGQVILVRMFKGEKPSNASSMIFDARDVVKRLTPAAK
jgi:hypothetical protein